MNPASSKSAFWFRGFRESYENSVGRDEAATVCGFCDFCDSHGNTLANMLANMLYRIQQIDLKGKPVNASKDY